MRMVTGDEKWVTYDSVKRKRSWSKSGEATEYSSGEQHPTPTSKYFKDSNQKLLEEL